MKKIKHDLLTKQKSRKHNLKVEIDLYPYAAELFDELNKIGIINRMKNTPQLGVIKVPKKLQKSRYDYIMLQLYLHQLIKKNLQGQLRLTYNNYVKAHEFNNEFTFNSKKEKPTIGDVLQLLSIVYNIGHFLNTFTASRAITIMSAQDDYFCNLIVKSSNSKRFIEVASTMLEEKNYQRLHLVNSLLILEKCDQNKQSVVLAKEILYRYINESEFPQEGKLYYAFSIFKNIRTVSYLAYDLQIADTPLTIDLCNEKAMVLILKELLSEYNNTTSSVSLVQSIGKLLDDTVYNENSNAICYYKISRKMVCQLQNKYNFETVDYYQDYFINENSILNKNYPHIRDYVQTQILKLTFQYCDRQISEDLLFDLERINNTRVGYYDRHSGEQTLVISIKKNCNRQAKIKAAFKVLKYTVSALRKIENIESYNSMFLLCTKFFLFYLFAENPVVIKPTIDDKKCVLCTRGKNNRINEIDKLLINKVGTDDERHEIEFLRKLLESDKANDTSITIPASILVYQKDAVGRKLCEIDGMIIHPMRKSNQIFFLEAKNTSNKPAFGKNCLKDKFDALDIEYDVDDISIIGFDAFMNYTV